jgi:hypothetical protein
VGSILVSVWFLETFGWELLWAIGHWRRVAPGSGTATRASTFVGFWLLSGGSEVLHGPPGKVGGVGLGHGFLTLGCY